MLSEALLLSALLRRNLDPSYVRDYLRRRRSWLATLDPSSSPPSLIPDFEKLTPIEIYQRVEDALLDRGIDPDYLADYHSRRRGSWLARITEALANPRAPVPPELWTAARRTRANLEALQVLQSLATKQPLTLEQRQKVQLYSGWGGLSVDKIRDKVAPEWLPDTVGLIHEYYTPSRLCAAVAEQLRPLLGALAVEGQVQALEPSAGIGRMVTALSGPGFEAMRWTAVELSPLSGRILRALHPGALVFDGWTFERWVAQYEGEYAGRLSFVFSNPPYGERGASYLEDPSPLSKQQRANAYRYFLLRTAGLLRAGGLSIHLIPYGFLTGQSKDLPRFREEVLRQHHLACAFRLPSQLFPGSNLPVDLVYLRSRGGVAEEIPDEDRPIAEGHYFELFPQHLLGKEIGRSTDDAPKRARRGYEVLGTFTGLPPLIERPLCTTCTLRVPEGPKTVVQVVAPEMTLKSGLAERLGVRVREFLAARTAGEAGNPAAAERAAGLYPELRQALLSWGAEHGAPYYDAELRPHLRTNQNLVSLASAFERADQLSTAFETAPTYRPLYRGGADDVNAQAEHLLARSGPVSLRDLAVLHSQAGGTRSHEALRAALQDADWVLDGDLFVPGRDYFTGQLWPRYDRDKARAAAGDTEAAARAARLLAAIAPATITEIAPDPRSGFLSLEVLREWLAAFCLDGVLSAMPPLERRDGIIQVADLVYGELASNVPAKLLVALGFLNHDYALFKIPGIEKGKAADGSPQGQAEAQDEARVKYAENATAHFTAWLAGRPDVVAQVEHDYNRTFRGFVVPTYSTAPLSIARYDARRKTPRGHQNAGARRLLANRRGMLSFDVGVGKTLTAILTMARAREEGWMKRPVFIVPNTLLWKWRKDIKDVLPDYQVAVIGARKRKLSRGDRKGQLVSELDTPQERALKWKMLQQGRVDCALVSYSIFPRLRADPATVEQWIAETPAIQRELRLRARNAQVAIERAKKTIDDLDPEHQVLFRRRNAILEVLGDESRESEHAEYQGQLTEVEALIEAAGAGPRRFLEMEKYRAVVEGMNALSEREQAIHSEMLRAWIAEQTSGEADPGISLEEVGIDGVFVDEAQNFKNLFTAGDREGGQPKYLGAIQEGSGRAWSMAILCGLVRRRNEGGGVFLLSATPAKNSPIEYVSLFSYVDMESLLRLGIYSAEEFIDRYMRLEYKDTYNQVEERFEKRMVVAGFKNLRELQEMVYRLAEFRTAEEVGIPLPEARPDRIVVEMSPEQQQVYSTLRRRALATKEEIATDPTARRRLLGLLHKMSLASVHHLLPSPPGSEDLLAPAGGGGGSMGIFGSIVGEPERKRRRPWEWSEAMQVPLADCHSPKLDAVVRKIMQSPHCGHIVFADNIAIHAWMVRCLVEAGMPEARIGLLNAVKAKDPAARQAIAEGFNGDEEAGKPPIYDVVIANAVAYEGIDLQVRTCAIYHLDLPYEPATLQQRNGRGVRQGNKQAVIEIWYVFSRKSSDIVRFQMISGKLGWQRDILKTADRETSNPLAGAEQSPEELIAQLAENEEEAAALIARAKAKMEEERKARIADAAWRAFRGLINLREARDKTEDAIERAQKAAELEKQRSYLQELEADAWPWYHLVDLALEGRRFWFHRELRGEQRLPDTVALWEGARYYPGDARGTAYEVGEQDAGGRMRLRFLGEITWREAGTHLQLLHEDFDPSDFEDWDEAQDRVGIQQQVEAWALRFRQGLDAWAGLMNRAPLAWRERLWAEHRDVILHSLVFAGPNPNTPLHFPVRSGDTLITRFVGLPGGGVMLAEAEQSAVLPFTRAGWEEFLAKAPGSNLTFGEADQAARDWWGRPIPRSLFSDAEGAAAAAPAPASATPAGDL